MADTIYAGTGDGYAGRQDKITSSWATIRAEADGEVQNTNDTEDFIYVISRRLTSKSFDGFQLLRALTPFNTGGTIPADATITAADLVLEQTDIAGDGAFQNCAVVQGAQPDETNIALGDYSSYDALDSPDEGAARFSVSANGTKTIPLNVTGLGWIKKLGEASNGGGSSGWTKFMIRTGTYDVDGTAPTATTSKVFSEFSSSTGANPPFLTVTWSSPGPPPLSAARSAVKIKGSQMRLKGGKVLIK